MTVWPTLRIMSVRSVSVSSIASQESVIGTSFEYFWQSSPVSSLSPAVAFTAYLRSQYGVFVSPHSQVQGDSEGKYFFKNKNKNSIPSGIFRSLLPLVGVIFWLWINPTFLPFRLAVTEEQLKFVNLIHHQPGLSCLGQSWTNSAAKMLVLKLKSHQEEVIIFSLGILPKKLKFSQSMPVSSRSSH